MAPQTQDPTQDREYILDQHVIHFLRKNPEIHKKHTIGRIQAGRYNVDGREITVDWHYGSGPEDAGYLVAIDGPLQQPFRDYLQGTEANAQFDDSRLKRSSLQQVPQANRLSFGENKNVYSRLEAMKIAKEQALVREKAAEYAKDGERVPESTLMERYQKVIDQKLGGRFRRQTAPTGPATVAAPVAPPPVATPQPEVSPSPAATADRKPAVQQKQGSPVYCSMHDKTEKRPKMNSHKAECTSCKNMIQTNYLDFTICPECSRAQNRCMCCGANAVGATGATEPATTSQGQPVYCCNHNSTEKRTKTNPRNIACSRCQTTAQTNYAEFTLCHGCSQQEQRCMCCGMSAGASAVAPAANPEAFMAQLQAMQSHQMMNAMAQPAVTPHNPMASMNVMASFNVMASQNAMIPQNPMSAQSHMVPQRMF